jgi:hypothetical protein
MIDHMHQQLKRIHEHILQIISISQTGPLGEERGGAVGEGGGGWGKGRGEDDVYLLRNLSYSNVLEAWVLVASRAFYVSRRTKHTNGTNGLGVARDHAEGEEGGQGVSEGGRGGAPRQGRLLMVPVLDMINHCAPRAGKNPPPHSPTNQSTGAGGDGRDVGGSRGGLGKTGARQSLGHNQWYLEDRGLGWEGDGVVVVVAGQPYVSGTEVCHTYSRALSASSYLLRYGFIPGQTSRRVWLPLAGTNSQKFSK